MKVAINICFGGFNLSNKAFEKLLEIKGIEYIKIGDDDGVGYVEYIKKDDPNYYLSEYEFSRSDEDLIRVIEEFGKEANGNFSEIKIVEIPDDVKFTIEDYDGNEHIAEVHRTWN